MGGYYILRLTMIFQRTKRRDKSGGVAVGMMSVIWVGIGHFEGLRVGIFVEGKVVF